MARLTLEDEKYLLEFTDRYVVASFLTKNFFGKKMISDSIRIPYRKIDYFEYEVEKKFWSSKFHFTIQPIDEIPEFDTLTIYFPLELKPTEVDKMDAVIKELKQIEKLLG